MPGRYTFNLPKWQLVVFFAAGRMDREGGARAPTMDGTAPDLPVFRNMQLVMAVHLLYISRHYFLHPFLRPTAAAPFGIKLSLVTPL